MHTPNAMGEHMHDMADTFVDVVAADFGRRDMLALLLPACLHAVCLPPRAFQIYKLFTHLSVPHPHRHL